MTKFVVDLWLDGYEDEEEHAKACEEFIAESLNFSASSVRVHRLGVDGLVVVDPCVAHRAHCSDWDCSTCRECKQKLEENE